MRRVSALRPLSGDHRPPGQRGFWLHGTLANDQPPERAPKGRAADGAGHNRDRPLQSPPRRSEASAAITWQDDGENPPERQALKQEGRRAGSKTSLARQAPAPLSDAIRSIEAARRARRPRRGLQEDRERAALDRGV